MDERVAYTDTRLAGASVLAIRSTFHREARVEELPDLTPSWRLKAIPRVDGRGADVLQLIDGAKVTSDVDVHVCRAGDGVIQCDPSPIYNLADFTPREYYGAYLPGAGLHRGLRRGGPRLPESRLKPKPAGRAAVGQ